MKIFLEGFLLQASLIMALGAQNLFVLESGLRRRHPLTVASICSLCDFTLIMIGVCGISTLFIQHLFLKIVIGVIGVGFLAYYGVQKIRENTTKVDLQNEKQLTYPRKQAVYKTLGFSLLNPHVFLDTLVLIGGFSAKFSLFSDRVLFGLGASAFSIVWFFSLVLLASSMQCFLKNPKVTGIILKAAGVILIYISIKLGIDVWMWIRMINT